MRPRLNYVAYVRYSDPPNSRILSFSFYVFGLDRRKASGPGVAMFGASLEDSVV